jgi:Ca-activated chloride channel family protein
MLLVRVWRRQTSRLVLPFDHSQAKRGRLLGFPVHLMESMPALLLGVVIIIVAGPQQLSAPKSRRSLTNIEFCVDISGSMTAKFGEGNRYDASMNAISKFVDFRKGDAFGLLFFGHTTLEWAPLTTDVSALKCALPFMRPDRVPPWFGGTEIGKALLECRKILLRQDEGDRMIVLVSDGMSSDLSGNRVEEIAAQLKESKIVVHAIHIGESDPPDQIVNLTAYTDGEVFGVGDPGMLEGVFQKIDKMHQAEMVQLAPETLDWYAPFAIAGLSLLGLITTGLFGLRFTPW